MNNMQYNAQDNIVYHFYQHVRYGLNHDIPRFGQPKNIVEKLGDVGLWTLENFPGKIWRLMKEPRWITLALTTISMSAVSYVFYSRESTRLAKAVWHHVQLPSVESVKFVAYLTIIGHIVSAAFRAYGRFRNDDLMDAWYNNRDANPVAAAAAVPN